MKDSRREEQTAGHTPAMSPGATTRKGPWTEEEDARLVRFVRLFGERRWDLLAKVSGLKRTGKSCRLRWVNYLHPGLRHGRITADEERLIVELHAKWGSRWSRIARSLPGRTDNEIKNYWRTRTRKMALEQRRLQSDSDSKTASPPSSSVASAGTSSASPTSSSPVTEWVALQLQERSSSEAELEEASTTTTTVCQHQQQPPYYQVQQEHYCYTVDQLWNEIASADAAAAAAYLQSDSWGPGHHSAAVELPSSPVWEFCSDYYSLWRIDDEEYYN